MDIYIDKKEKLISFKEMLTGDQKYLLSAENLERYCKGKTYLSDYIYNKLRTTLKAEFKEWKNKRGDI